MDQSPDIKTGLDNTIVFASRKGAAVVLTFFAAGITCETFLWGKEAAQIGTNLIECVDTAELPYAKHTDGDRTIAMRSLVLRGAPNRVVLTFWTGPTQSAFHLSHAAAKELGGPLWVVKSQIHAGGRGKGKFKELGPDAKGGVRLAKTLDEVRAAATDMLGNTLVTIQTGEHGKQVNRLYVTDGVDIDKEFYLALLVNRASGRIGMVVSTEGGMDIETVAHDTPEKIHTIDIDPATGFMPHHGRSVAAALGLSGDLAKQAASTASRLYDAFLGTDAAQIEINPLAVTKDGQLMVLDAKVGFDSNALFRHKDLMALRDETEEDPAELEASKYDLAYIKLDGDIGCMVNGAGLAMATMDIIKLYGEQPANFLDVGGGATKEKVTAAFKIITTDPNVKGILVNIFGGIMDCNVIATGIVAAVKEVGLKLPLVVK